MYLTVLTTGTVSWGGLDTNNDSQVWALISTSAAMNYTLDVYQIMNQKYSGYNGEMWDGCEAAAFSNVGAFYHKGYYTYAEMKSEGFVNGAYHDNGDDGAVDNYGAVKYMKITDTHESMNYSLIKSELDAERPVLIRMYRSVDEDDKHTVMVYGYQNACSSMNDLLVLDSANTNNALDDVGLFFTLSESMEHNSMDRIKTCRTTDKK